MDETTRKQPSVNERSLAWFWVGGVAVFTLVTTGVGILWASSWPAAGQAAFILLALAAAGWAAYEASRHLGALRHRGRELEARLQRSERLVNEAQERLAALSRLRQQLVDANREEDVISSLLSVVLEFSRAAGASFVPLDERNQPMPAITVNSSDIRVPEAWVEYLATPAVRDRCKVCEKHHHFSTTCPLLKGPFSEGMGLYCLPLRRGQREFGVLNVYFELAKTLDAEARTFLQAVVDEASLALEGVWLRNRELGALRQIQTFRPKADLKDLFSSLLENVYLTLEADFALLVVSNPEEADEKGEHSMQIRYGTAPEAVLGYIEGVVQGVMSSGEPLLIGHVSSDRAAPASLHSLLAAPLLVADQPPFGALLVSNCRSRSFNNRHLGLLQTVAAQIALVVQSTRQLAELEYKTMVDERTRLAREIHDGLAQTLGFLKLQVAQMQGYLDRGEMARLQGSMRTYYEALAEAYQDARYAIDGLRIDPLRGVLSTWLKQALIEFQESLGPQNLTVTLACTDTQSQLPPEVQAQLIRIVQEALSNIRKHADARNLWVSCTETAVDMVLEIRDDGRGFAPADVPGPSQHGLRGMRERAELIGADFQIISPPGGGTTVRVSIPLKVGERLL